MTETKFETSGSQLTVTRIFAVNSSITWQQKTAVWHLITLQRTNIIGGTASRNIPDVTIPTTGEPWKDPNLGASQVATSSTDEASYGDLYHW